MPVSPMMTRGQFAYELATRLGLDMTSTGGFSDTKGSNYDSAVTALKNAGISMGTGGGNFDPYSTISREQAATMIGRAYNISQGGASQFSDVAATHYASSFLNGLKDAGIFQGTGGGTFGLGQGFTFNQWDLVQGRLGSYQANQNNVAAGAPAGNTNTPTPPDVDAYKWAEQYITDNFDLPGMGDWVQQMVSQYGASLDAATIDLELRLTDQFKTRFGPILDGRKNAGLNAISPSQILQTEDALGAIMRASGLPSGFYDQREDFTSLIINDVSPNELQQRIATGFTRVSQAPIEVRQAYADFYGVQGDEALAAYMLDPAKAVPVLERQVQTAEVAGTGAQFGMTLNQQRAEQLAGNGIDEKMAFTGFSRLSALSGLFSESINQGTDLTAEGVGIDAVLLGQGDAQQALDRRLQERKAESSGGGGAFVDQTGVLGTGTAL